jgi:hypothetical protein
MRRIHNANDFALEYRRCRSNYDRTFGAMVADIRAKFATGVDASVDDSLEAHLRTYVVNDLLRALNWNMGIAPDAGLPNLVPEAPLWSPTTKTQRFLDYLGIERTDCARPLLVVETKRPSAALPQPLGRRVQVDPAEAVALGLQGKKLSVEWSTWLNDLRDYARAVELKTGTMPKKVVITNGTWIIIFTDPQDAFGISGTVSASKILVFEDEAAVDADYPLLFRQLEYSKLSDVREPIDVSEVAFCIRAGTVARVVRGVQLLYIENPGINDPPSPFIKIVPLLFLGSTTGEWVCVKGPGDIEMPSRDHELPAHIAEVDQVSSKMIADCATILGGLPAPTSLDAHFASGLDRLPGVREIRANMYFVVTGQGAHYYREQPSVHACPWHDWQKAKDVGLESSHHIRQRSVDPRAYFRSGESQHCAHRSVQQMKRSQITASNRGDCGPRSGRDGEAFCEVWSFDTHLCCRTCAFETVCTSSKIFPLPCTPGSVAPTMSDSSGPTSARLIQLQPRAELPSSRRSRLLENAENRALLEVSLRALVDEQRLLRPSDLWGVRNENEARVTALTNASIFAQWHGAEFLQPLPEAMAYAEDDDVDTIIGWTQMTLDCLVEADIARPNQKWTTAELSSRCGLRQPEFAIGLLYVRFLVVGCNPLDIGDDGLPTGAGLIRSVRTAPAQTLRDRVENERRAAN